MVNENSKKIDTSARRRYNLKSADPKIVYAIRAPAPSGPKKLHNEDEKVEFTIFGACIASLGGGVSPFVLQSSEFMSQWQRPWAHVALTGQWEGRKGYPGQSVYSNRII